MRALVIHAAKDLRIEEADVPPVGPDEVEIAVRAGGICGSDLHYYQHGGFGAVRLREPMILGHEISGEIVATGSKVREFSPGDRVAISPSRPCMKCSQCLAGRPNHCLDMRFYGSAMPMPHIQGAFRERLVARAEQCHRIDDHVTFNQAAFAEPLSVVLHAVNRAGSLFGGRALITGCGPIGLLAVLAARRAGASEIVVTDIATGALERAIQCGADQAINVAREPKELERFAAGKGHFDIAFEASGSPAAIAPAMASMRPKGILVQLGLGGDIAIPVNLLVSREIDMRGSFRFHEEFAQAVHLINRGEIDVASLLSHRFALADALAAFETAGDRTSAVKVQIEF
jgi:L-idonate 5-dehydrogenase